MKFEPVKFKNDKVSYIAPSWEEMGELAFDLGKKVLVSKKKFDRLVTVAKGGWTWSRTMADFLKIKEVGSIQVKFYTDIFKTKNKPVITQSLPTSVIKEKLLVFDDIVDSGETFISVIKYLNLCGAENIATASLFSKPWTKFIPDFYSAETKAWIIMPHEIREAVGLIGKKWYKQGLTIGKIKQRFIKIGLPESQVEYFLKKDKIKEGK